jgi:hypothetical protein
MTTYGGELDLALTTAAASGATTMLPAAAEP